MTISNPISHHLGPIKGWRYKRLHIAVALRKQGWSYTKIADYLFMTPKTIMRDIKCLAIQAHCIKKYKFHSRLDAWLKLCQTLFNYKEWFSSNWAVNPINSYPLSHPLMTLHKGGCKEIHVQLNIFLKSTQYKLTITIGSAVLIAKCSDFIKKATQLIGSHDERLQID